MTRHRPAGHAVGGAVSMEWGSPKPSRTHTPAGPGGNQRSTPVECEEHDMSSRRKDEADTDPGAGTGDGGPTGTPSRDWEEEPPSHDQDTNSVVSGGGLVGPDDGDDGVPPTAE